jgi:23S rRNA pseudouridine1911/1915/1917 synthase
VTLRERLAQLFPEASGHRRKRWLAMGRVRLNGRVERDGRAAVGAADAVELGAPAGRATPAAAAGGVRIVYEDDHLVVIDKPPGLLTVATERERERTAYRITRAHLAARRAGPLFIVHRLDRETSGLIVLARSLPAKRDLQAQFAARTVLRTYLAVVHGEVRRDRGTLVSHLVEDGASLRVRSARARRREPPGAPTAREAITHYRVRERRRGTTLLELTLHTGRPRQIRVQLAEMGHPVVGDRPGRAGDARDWRGGRASARAGRLLLHAMRLGFVHPGTGEPVRFECPPPAAFGIPLPSPGFAARPGLRARGGGPRPSATPPTPDPAARPARGTV